MQVFLGIFMMIVTLGIFGFSLWYTAFRLHVHFASVPFWTLQIVIILCAIFSFVFMFVSSKSASRFLSFLNIISGYILLFIIFLFFLLAVLHLIQLKWSLPLMQSGVAALLVVFAVIAAGAVMASPFVVRETEIRIPGLENRLTIMQVSDAHIGHHRGRNYLARIVEETNKHAPDLVLITGDLVDAEPALLPGVLDPLSGFNAPVYFIDGNHEKDVGAERVIELIRRQGVRVMQNEIIETHGIQLIGLEYMKADEDTFDMHPSDKTDTIKSVLAGLSIRKDIPSIVMHHSPVGVQYAEAAGINLMLSGHTHGGQVFPFSLISRLNFSFNGGLYRQGNTKVFVSKGAGTFMARVRLGSFNEINLLRLLPED